MQHLFSQVPTVQIPRSKFNRSHGLKTTFEAGKLIPIFIDEVLPADTFNLKATIFIRMPALVTPFMDNLYVDTFFFYVPERLVYDKFQKMCGEQDNPYDSTDYIFPTLAGVNVAVGSLWDYFGLPTGIANQLSVRAEPFRAYWLIWNEWFRDENLQDSVILNIGEAAANDSIFQDTDSRFADGYTVLAPRGKRHDYFTSALPWPQKGPGVELPLVGNAPIMAQSPSTGIGSQSFDTQFPTATDHTNQALFWDSNQGFANFIGIGDNPSRIWAYADLSGTASATINSLREAFQIQKWYERAARGGTRYTEILLSFFGVKSPDARLQRPEYLGGTTQRIQVTQVPQTSSTDEKTPQANLAAFGLTATKRHGFTKSFVEHGWIIGLMCVRSDLTYQQGINRMWSRSTKFDMYWPPFAHLGEQAVLNKEIYAQGTAADDDVFGYQERYAEYRYYPSLITGEMRSTYAQSLDFWHLAQKFDSLPQLNEEFIEENVPVDRVVAVTDEPPFLADIWFDMNCVRPMPVYSVPGLVDHF